MTKEVAQFLLEVLGRVSISASDENFEQVVGLITKAKAELLGILNDKS